MSKAAAAQVAAPATSKTAMWEATLESELGGRRELEGRREFFRFLKKTSTAVTSLAASLVELDKVEAEPWIIAELNDLMRSLSFELQVACEHVCAFELGAEG